jgi:cytochrome c biogenesis protein CcdA
MIRAVFFILISLVFTAFLCPYATAGNVLTMAKPAAQQEVQGGKYHFGVTGVVTAKTEYDGKELFSAGGATSVSGYKKAQSLLWLFIQSLIAGILAVFTPYVYTILPFTVGYLSQSTKTKEGKLRNTLYYGVSIVIIFSVLGVLISIILGSTGLRKFTDHWLFNLFFCRIFAILGITFLGAFSIQLKSSWVNFMAEKAKSGSFTGIFFMALTLPVASFSSTFPIIGVVLLLAGSADNTGPIIGMLGFSIGLALPFVFPQSITIIDSHKSSLNNIRVILGFVCLLIAFKLFSNADASLGWHLLDREIFIAIWILLSVLLGIYMLGKMKLINDYAPESNIYGQEYIPLAKLFIAIISFSFAIYLLPGMWGAPLHGVSGFLPH